MTPLALLRHAPTQWNRDRRLQGRTDTTPLAECLTELSRHRLPDAYSGFRVLCSPLRRCLETAAALRLTAVAEPRLIEMDWGMFEGRTLTELRAERGAALAAAEARGLDFRPEGGESPREVCMRIASLLQDIARDGQSTLAITHRGVIRVLYARAVGWDMTGAPPHRLDLGMLQLFTLDPGGAPRLVQPNIPLEAR